MGLGWDEVRVVLAAIDAGPFEELELEVADLHVVVRKRRPGGQLAERSAGDAEFELKSPAVGVLRRAPVRGGAPFVSPGAIVRADDVLALVEVVREEQAVRAPASAQVVAVLVDDGEFVEYGRPLMILRPIPWAP